jgi:D-beta-D-heptose 7-phosphate kinase/D-beta-D-heptose 1-phosphate adenosyltransferase
MAAETDVVRSFSGKRIIVIGDLILDRYVWGKANRISQEAPVPVVRVLREELVLGGAANVLHNLVSLGAEPYAFGIIGQDESGHQLRDDCQSAGINTDGVIAVENRKTTLKTRVIADQQQVVRIDDEDTEDIDSTTTQALLDALRTSVQENNIEALIIEDYNKGVITTELAARIVDIAKAASIPLALDPHPGNRMTLDHVTLMTPNHKEAFAMASLYEESIVLPLSKDAHLKQAADAIAVTWNVDQLLITLGADGMALFSDGADVVHIPTKAKEVFDVSGAGDTVIAVYTLAIAAGAEARMAAAVANVAAGIVVGKVGTVSVTADELLAALA